MLRLSAQLMLLISILLLYVISDVDEEEQLLILQGLMELEGWVDLPLSLMLCWLVLPKGFGIGACVLGNANSCWVMFMVEEIIVFTK